MHLYTATNRHIDHRVWDLWFWTAGELCSWIICSWISGRDWKDGDHSGGQAGETNKKQQFVAGFHYNLGCGNSNIFYFHPENWGNDPI